MKRDIEAQSEHEKTKKSCAKIRKCHETAVRSRRRISASSPLLVEVLILYTGSSRRHFSSCSGDSRSRTNKRGKRVVHRTCQSNFYSRRDRILFLSSGRRRLYALLSRRTTDRIQPWVINIGHSTCRPARCRICGAVRLRSFSRGYCSPLSFGCGDGLWPGNSRGGAGGF